MLLANKVLGLAELAAMGRRKSPLPKPAILLMALAESRLMPER
jgi:hypothetical protein